MKKKVLYIVCCNPKTFMLLLKKNIVVVNCHTHKRAFEMSCLSFAVTKKHAFAKNIIIVTYPLNNKKNKGSDVY